MGMFSGGLFDGQSQCDEQAWPCISQDKRPAMQSRYGGGEGKAQACASNVPRRIQPDETPQRFRTIFFGYAGSIVSYAQDYCLSLARDGQVDRIAAIFQGIVDQV